MYLLSAGSPLHVAESAPLPPLHMPQSGEHCWETYGLPAEVRMDDNGDGTLLEATHRYVVKTLESTQSQLANSNLMNDKRTLVADFSTAPRQGEYGQMVIVNANNGLNITTAAPQCVNIYSIAGTLMHSEVVSGNAHIALPAGVYVIDGRKYLVR